MRVLTSCIFYLLWMFVDDQSSEQKGYAFRRGETLTYKLSYGWIPVGRGSFEIDADSQSYKGVDCFSVKASGASSGLLRMVSPINDEWGAMISVNELKPVFTYRNIREGRYRLNEEVFINLDSGTIRVESVKPHRTQSRRPTRNYEFDPSTTVNDMLSGLLKIRNHDFSEFRRGDTLELQAFFEDSFYDLKVVYMGREQLKTKLGMLKAHKIIPLMPQNSVFDGEYALEAWLSDDLNKVPLKITARMFIGKASAEILSYQNIKYGPDSD